MAKAQTGKHGGPSHPDTGEDIPEDEEISPNEPVRPGGQSGEKRLQEEARAREEAYRRGETRPTGETYSDRDRDTYAREAEEDASVQCQSPVRPPGASGRPARP